MPGGLRCLSVFMPFGYLKPKRERRLAVDGCCGCWCDDQCGNNGGHRLMGYRGKFYVLSVSGDLL